MSKPLSMMVLDATIVAWKKRGIKAKDIANKLEVSPTYLTFVTSGKSIPSPEFLKEFAKYMEIDPKKLLEAAKKIKIQKYIELMEETYK